MRSVTAHDFARRSAQTLRERAVLRGSRQSKPSYPVDANEHVRRMLRTEFNGGIVLGCIFGYFACLVTLALSFPWWAPLIVWMVRQ